MNYLFESHSRGHYLTVVCTTVLHSDNVAMSPDDSN